MLFRLDDLTIADVTESDGVVTAEIFHVTRIEKMGKQYRNKAHALMDIRNRLNEAKENIQPLKTED